MSEELLKRIGKLEGDIKIFQEENAELKKENEAKQAEADESKKKAEEAEKKAEEAGKEAEEAKAKVAEVEEEKKEAEINSKVEKYVSEGKVLPIQGKFLKEIIKNSKINSDKKFTIDEKEYNSIEDLIHAFVESNDQKFTTEQSAHNKGKGSDDEDAKVTEVKKLMKEKGISFKEAYLELSEQNSKDDSSEE